LIVAGALLVGVAGTALAATVPGAVYGDAQAQGINKPAEEIKQDLVKAGIVDVKPTDWAAGSLMVSVQAGLLKPDQTGHLNPKGSVSKNEGIAVFAKVLGVAGKTDDDATAAKKAKDAGLVGNTTAPDKDMTRLDVAKLLATALGVVPRPFVTPSTYPFNDFIRVSADDAALLAALYDMGIFKGFEDHTFRPDGVLTKAQIAILIDRILGAQAR
jgi:hypothetical protein